MKMSGETPPHKQQEASGRRRNFRVAFGFNKSAYSGPWKELYQKGQVFSESCAEWRVQPKLMKGSYLPFKLPFLIVDLAADGGEPGMANMRNATASPPPTPGSAPYDWVTVGFPSRAFLWIMARNRTLPPAVYEGIKGRAVAMGFDESKIQMVPQAEDAVWGTSGATPSGWQRKAPVVLKPDEVGR